MTTAAGDRADGVSAVQWTTTLTVVRLALVLAASHLAVLAVRPDPTPTELAIFEGVVLVALVANELRETRSLAQSASLGVVVVAVVGGAWLALWVGLGLLPTTLLFAVVIVVCSYGLYRYHLLVLGRAEGANEH